MSERVNITLPTGEAATVPQEDLAQALAAGAKTIATPESSGEDSGGLLGQIAAGVLGAGSTATLGLTDKLAREIPYIVGGDSAAREVTSQLHAVRERNPYSTMAGEVGGLLLNPEAFSAVGEAAAAPIAARVGEGLLARGVTSAAKMGAETALMGAQHEITEESLGNHDLNAQAIWSQAAKEGMLGAGLGFGGSLLFNGGKALVGRTSGLLSRPGPMSSSTLDELVGGVEGAGREVEGHASRAERTIENLRASGATTDQAVEMVQGLEAAAKARTEALHADIDPTASNISSFAERIARGERLESPSDIQFYQNNAKSIEAELQRLANGIPNADATRHGASSLVDQAADEYASRMGAKNPERAEILRQHYRDVLKPIEEGASGVDRTALDMTKYGNSWLRNGEDIMNEAQFTMKPDRFNKLVDTSLVDQQADQIANFLQKVDEKLSFWESQADRGGNAGAIRDLRKQWTAMNQDLVRIGTSDGENLSRDLLIRFNSFKQTLDGHVPFGRAPGAVIDGSRQFFGMPAATRDLSELADVARGALEDESVWGPAAAAQARENLSFSENFSRHIDLIEKFGDKTTETMGVRVPEFDYSKTRGVLDKITGNAEIDEALQPIKSARAAIDRGRARIGALRESGELTEGQVSKLAQAEKDLNAFESSLNGAMKEAAKANRLKAAVLEEGHSGMGGLLGAALDTVNRPLTTMKRLAQVKHTYEKVAGGLKSAIRAVTESGGSSTEGVAARKVTPRAADKVVEEMQTMREVAGNPARLEQAAARMVGDLARHAPQTADALRMTAIRAIVYLAREAPPASISESGAFGPPKARYSDVQIHDWETKRNAAMNPTDVVEDMKHGRLNRDAIRTAKFVAPEMYAEMQNLMRDQIAAMSARGELDRMPYQQKAVIASLLEVPADRTFEPDFVAMMQAAKAMPAPAPTGPAPKKGGGGGSPGPVQPPAWLTTEAQRIETGGM